MNIFTGNAARIRWCQVQFTSHVRTDRNIEYSVCERYIQSYIDVSIRKYELI